MVELNSRGQAATSWNGGRLGQYEVVEGRVEDGALVYRQRHTVSSYNNFLFKSGQYWIINRAIGKADGPHLVSLSGLASGSTSPPRAGWQVWEGWRWVSDTSMTAGPPSPGCPSVTVGVEARDWRSRLGVVGEYRVEEGQWCMGRPVYRQLGGRRHYLTVHPSKSSKVNKWGVRSHWRDKQPVVQSSSNGQACPCQELAWNGATVLC